MQFVLKPANKDFSQAAFSYFSPSHFICNTLYESLNFTCIIIPKHFNLFRVYLLVPRLVAMFTIASSSNVADARIHGVSGKLAAKNFRFSEP